MDVVASKAFVNWALYVEIRQRKRQQIINWTVVEVQCYFYLLSKEKSHLPARLKPQPVMHQSSQILEVTEYA